MTITGIRCYNYEPVFRRIVKNLQCNWIYVYAYVCIMSPLRNSTCSSSLLWSIRLYSGAQGYQRNTTQKSSHEPAIPLRSGNWHEWEGHMGTSAWIMQGGVGSDLDHSWAGAASGWILPLTNAINGILLNSLVPGTLIHKQWSMTCFGDLLTRVESSCKVPLERFNNTCHPFLLFLERPGSAGPSASLPLPRALLSQCSWSVHLPIHPVIAQVLPETFVYAGSYAVVG